MSALRAAVGALVLYQLLQSDRAGEGRKVKCCLQNSCPEPPPIPAITSRLSSESTRTNLKPFPSKGKWFHSAALWQPSFDFLLRS